MEHSKANIDYSKVIGYEFKQYYLNHGLKKLGQKKERVVTEELSWLHMRDTFRPKSAEHLTKEQNQDAL